MEGRYLRIRYTRERSNLPNRLYSITSMCYT